MKIFFHTRIWIATKVSSWTPNWAAPKVGGKPGPADPEHSTEKKYRHQISEPLQQGIMHCPRYWLQLLLVCITKMTRLTRCQQCICPLAHLQSWVRVGAHMGPYVFFKSVTFRVQTAPFDKIRIEFWRSRRRLYIPDLLKAKKMRRQIIIF